MSRENNRFEKEFIAFERDIDLSGGEPVPVDEMSFPYLDSFSNPSKATTASSNSTPEPVVQPEELREEKTIAELASTMDEMIPHHLPPLSESDMRKLSERLEKAIAAITPLQAQGQRMLKPDNGVRLPKGLRTTESFLTDITSVLVATEAIVNLYVEIGVEPLYQAVDDFKLKTTSNSTINTFMAHVTTMQQGLDDVEKNMSEGYDRPSANLRMRIVKAQVSIVQTMAVQQAQALSQTIEAFPVENGSLRLLCLLEEKGDKAVMDSIDRTMMVAHHVQVPVADAPKMLKAIVNNDKETVEAIVNRMIEQS